MLASGGSDEVMSYLCGGEEQEKSDDEPME